MTGGTVVVLGKTGKNFAAGMSGGIAYVLDEDTSLYKRVNKQLVSMEAVSNKYDVLELKQLITEHVAYTNSKKGKEILDNFGEYLPKFKKIMPHDYKKMLNLVENGKYFDMTYAQCMFDVYIDEDKEVSQCLNMNYGHVLAEEIINHLDYRLAMKLADNNDTYNRSLSVAEKMQILYSHQMLLKK